MENSKITNVIELNDDALNDVSGGAYTGTNPKFGYSKKYCNKCKKDTNFREFSGGRCRCLACGGEV